MNLADWIRRTDIRGTSGVKTFQGVLEAAFPAGHPRHGLIPRFLEAPSVPEQGMDMAIPHLTVEGPLHAELVVVLVPEGVPVGAELVRLWVVGVFGSGQPELRLQVLSLVAGFCRQRPFDADPEAFYEKICQFSAPGNRVLPTSVPRTGFGRPSTVLPTSIWSRGRAAGRRSSGPSNAEW